MRLFLRDILATFKVSELFNIRGIVFGASWLISLRKITVMGTILVIILILVLIGVVPTWPHSSGWGYGPSGLVGTVLIILLILILLGRI